MALEIKFIDKSGEIVSKSHKTVYGAFQLTRGDRLRRRIVEDWCFRNNVIPKVKNDLYWFYKEEDAMAFKLVWLV